MIPWRELDRVAIPGQAAELSLHRRDTEFSIRIARLELMNSRMHGSEEALARLACERVRSRPKARVLVGGLGMGFTLAEAERQLAEDAELVVAELVPAVVRWNREHLGELAGHPLNDPRVQVYEGDVALLMASEPAAYDAILLDVDNGPDGLTHEDNDWLYGKAGLQAAARALRPRGVLAVWSAASDDSFTARLRHTNFKVDEVAVRARGHKGARHTIWLATKA